MERRGKLFVPDLSYNLNLLSVLKVSKAGEVTEFDRSRLSNCGFQQEVDSMCFKMWESLHMRV